MGAIGTVVGMLSFLRSIGVGSNRLHVAQAGSCGEGRSSADSAASAKLGLVSDVSGRIFNISDLGSGTGLGLLDTHFYRG